MLFYKKVRFWGGLTMALEPFIFDNLQKDWVFIGFVVALSSLLSRENFKKADGFLCGREKKYADSYGKTFTLSTSYSVRRLLVYASILSLILWIASLVNKILSMFCNKEFWLDWMFLFAIPVTFTIFLTPELRSGFMQKRKNKKSA